MLVDVCLKNPALIAFLRTDYEHSGKCVHRLIEMTSEIIQVSIIITSDDIKQNKSCKKISLLLSLRITTLFETNTK